MISFVPETRNSRLSLLFFVCLFATLGSKGMALLPGYAFDDYTVTYIDATVPYYLSQGRFTQAALQWLATAAGINITSIYWPVALSLLLAFPAMVAYGFSKIGDSRTPVVPQAIGAAIVCAHPYFTEYFTFRQALYNALVYVVMMGGHFWALFHMDLSRTAWAVDNRRATLASSAFLLVALGGHQLTFAMCLVVASMSLIVARAQAGDSGARVWLRQACTLATPYAVAAVAYVVLYVLLKKVSGAANDPRGNVLSIAELPGRLVLLAGLVRKIFLQPEPVLSLIAKMLAWIPLAVLMLISLRRAFVPAAWGFVALVAVAAVSLAPVGLSGEWWPVPRSLSALGFVVGAGATALLLLGASRSSPVLAAGLTLSSVLMVAHSASMLSDQSRLNRWDMNKAQLIAHDVVKRFGTDALLRTHLVNGRWDYPARLRTPDGDLNSSSFVKPWSTPGLLMEATGYSAHFGPPVDPKLIECAKRARWPQDGAIYQASDAIIVCL